MNQPTTRGQLVRWPIGAQGVSETGKGTVIAVVHSGGRPCDHWPKDMPKPEKGQLRDFTKPREQGYCIVAVAKGDKTVYRTPRLTAPVEVVEAKKK